LGYKQLLRPFLGTENMPSPTLEQFGDSLAQSFQNLWEFRREFEQRSFAGFDDAARQITLFWDPKFLPNFEAYQNVIKSRQESFFTIFVFAEALSEFLIGLEELRAYQVLEREDYDQFANFASYTSCFHLIDSFLCLRGLYHLWNPVGDCEWKMFRRMRDPRAVGAPVFQLEPSPLRLGRKSLSFLLARWAGTTTRNHWVLEASDIRSVHVSRWRSFGEQLETALREDGMASIPNLIRSFFGLFSGHLAYQGLREDDGNTPQGLSRLIQFGCKDTAFEGVRRGPLIPKLRNIAIYRNQSLDEHLRLIARELDLKIVDSPAKLVGRNFHGLAEGLSQWQNDHLATIVSTVETILGRDSNVFLNGMRSAFLFSGLVELDFYKVVNSVCYNALHPSLRETIAPIFRNQRFIPLRPTSHSLNVGTPQHPQFRVLRIPITIPDVLALRNEWFRTKA